MKNSKHKEDHVSHMLKDLGKGVSTDSDVLLYNIAKKICSKLYDKGYRKSDNG